VPNKKTYEERIYKATMSFFLVMRNITTIFPQETGFTGNQIIIGSFHGKHGNGAN
jgi:hypothetical protein